LMILFFRKNACGLCEFTSDHILYLNIDSLILILNIFWCYNLEYSIIICNYQCFKYNPAYFTPLASARLLQARVCTGCFNKTQDWFLTGRYDTSAPPSAHLMIAMGCEWEPREVFLYRIPVWCRSGTLFNQLTPIHPPYVDATDNGWNHSSLLPCSKDCLAGRKKTSVNNLFWYYIRKPFQCCTPSLIIGTFTTTILGCIAARCLGLLQRCLEICWYTFPHSPSHLPILLRIVVKWLVRPCSPLIPLFLPSIRSGSTPPE